MPQLTFKQLNSRRMVAAGFGFLAAIGLIITPALATEISVSTEKPKQGQTVEITVRDLPDGQNPAELEFNGNSYRLFPAEKAGEFSALISVPADLKLGTYKVRVGSQEKKLPVVSGQFAVQKLRLPKSKDNFDTSPGERETIKAAKETLTPTRHWSGTFIQPSKGRTSGWFGTRRIVNGKLLDDYFHSGVDYAGGLGSPVRATAPGKVVMAARGFKLHGNCIAIDHGQGVVSIYIHLQKVLVKKGQFVKAGEEIGKIGQTGRASGPHLHFSLYVNQVATNPMDWYKTTF
jgi:murein DD-endopeptidase MepM/ murein hydrolase activator NlpD